MGNGVETEQITSRTDYRLGEPPSITYVGRLHEQKDLGTLLQAVSGCSWHGQGSGSA